MRSRSLALRPVAQTKKRRRRKHRGTQGGSIDTRGPRGRPRTREEARARARQKQSTRGKQRQRVDRRDIQPTWRTAFYRGLFGSAVFFLLFWLFGRPPAASAGLAVALLAIYVPLGYYVDMFFWRRRMRQLQAARAAAKQERRGS
jgi:drug/metabolite transporter (DMT)-like permease